MRHIPGVGKYNVTKTFDEIKKDIEEMKKRRIKYAKFDNILDKAKKLVIMMILNLSRIPSPVQGPIILMMW